MLLILEAHKDDLKQFIEGARSVLQSRTFHSFSSTKAKDLCPYGAFTFVTIRKFRNATAKVVGWLVSSNAYIP